MSTSRSATSQAFRIGVIADTHGLFDQAIVRHFNDVDYIIHAGDIGNRSVLRRLEALAPVIAVSGNVDGYGRSGYPSERIIELGGRRIGLRHVLFEGGKLTKAGQTFLERERPDVCIFGHTHQPRAEWFGKTLLFNPGSAGPKRFTFPRALGIIRISEGRVIGRHITLSGRTAKSCANRLFLKSIGKRIVRGRARGGAERSLKQGGIKC
jgi:putative phosphoesterase